MPDSQDQTPSAVQTPKASILAKLRYSVGATHPRPVPTWFGSGGPWRCATTSSTTGRRPPRKVKRPRASGSHLSLEFLIGRLLLDNLGNLGCSRKSARPLPSGRRPRRIALPLEPDAALGNGGPQWTPGGTLHESTASLTFRALWHPLRSNFFFFFFFFFFLACSARC